MKKYLFIKDTFGNYEPIYTEIQKATLDADFSINGVDVYKINHNNDDIIPTYVGELIFASDYFYEFSEMVNEFYKILEKYKEKEKDMEEYFKLHRITPSNKVDRLRIIYSKDLQTQLGMKKLEKLEDIEDILGIDIVRLYKAHTQKIIYHKNRVSNEIDECNCVYSSITKYENDTCEFMLSLDNLNNEESYTVTPNDYGKTWALTKEELKDKKEK